MRITTCLLLAAALSAQNTQPSFENDQVVINQPHPNVDVPGYNHKAHIHPFNRVMVYMHEGGEYLHYLADGRKEDLKWHQGQVVWSPSNGWHYSEMKPDVPPFTGPMIIDIGVKKEGDPSKAKLTALDPLKVDAKHFSLELDNPQVRVLRVKLAPKESTAVTESSLNRLVVYISDTNVREISGGKPEVVVHKPAEFVWKTPSKSKIENLSDKPFEAVIVEFRS